MIAEECANLPIDVYSSVVQRLKDGSLIVPTNVLLKLYYSDGGRVQTPIDLYYSQKNEILTTTPALGDTLLVGSITLARKRNRNLTNFEKTRPRKDVITHSHLQYIREMATKQLVEPSVIKNMGLVHMGMACEDINFLSGDLLPKTLSTLKVPDNFLLTTEDVNSWGIAYLAVHAPIVLDRLDLGLVDRTPYLDLIQTDAYQKVMERAIKLGSLGRTVYYPYKDRDLAGAIAMIHVTNVDQAPHLFDPERNLDRLIREVRDEAWNGGRASGKITIQSRT